ncbi:MAG: YaiI/YqxD family protein [Candidatus Eisenbacteria bacterium]|nr:YaiI/YqxD family protein [Candidatus Eisenbacteria bacterium]
MAGDSRRAVEGQGSQPCAAQVSGRLSIPMRIYVDADACPVKPEVYRVAKRHGVGVTLVAATWLRVPPVQDVALEVVEAGLDAADEWIASHAGAGDVVVTADIPLAARCVANGARVLGPTGQPFTEENVGEALATRNLLADLRGAGLETTTGPAPFDARDRSRFLQALDETLHALRRE